jgi:hypothetical protein
MDNKNLTWNVNFLHNGKLQFIENKKDYPYLYYECDWRKSVGEKDIYNLMCIASEQVEEELDKLLEKMGLNYVERCDFMTYWLPQLTEKKYVSIGFVKDKAYNEIVGLTVNPPPEVLIRVIMVFKNTNEFDGEWASDLQTFQTLNEDVSVTKVVEWGAMRLI